MKSIPALWLNREDKRYFQSDKQENRKKLPLMRHTLKARWQRCCSEKYLVRAPQLPQGTSSGEQKVTTGVSLTSMTRNRYIPTFDLVHNHLERGFHWPASQRWMEEAQRRTLFKKKVTKVKESGGVVNCHTVSLVLCDTMWHCDTMRHCHTVSLTLSPGAGETARLVLSGWGREDSPSERKSATCVFKISWSSANVFKLSSWFRRFFKCISSFCVW